MSESTIEQLRAALVESELEHRVLAFVYAWVHLIEPPAKDSARILELVTDDAVLHLSDGSAAETPEQIAQWYTRTAGAVEASAHRVEHLEASRAADGTLRAAIDFAWQGIAAGDQAMTARTHHEWTLVDDGGPLPRLREFRVTAVEPFAPATAEDALADFRDR